MRASGESATFVAVDALRAQWHGAGRVYRRLMTEYALVWDIVIAVAVAIVGLADSVRAAAMWGAVVFGFALVFRRRFPVVAFLVVFVVAALTGRDHSLGTFFALL